MKIKKGDTVKILTGKDKGKSGKVIKAIPKENKVIIEGLNIVKKHQKAKKGTGHGQVVEVAMPIDVSNVSLGASKKLKAKLKTKK